jgi:hypothetical protein
MRLPSGRMGHVSLPSLLPAAAYMCRRV